MGNMGAGSGSATRYVVRIGRKSADAFGWEFSREDDSIVVHRSTRMFPTRVEAILDAARAGAALSIAIDLSAVEGDRGKGE